MTSARMESKEKRERQAKEQLDKQNGRRYKNSRKNVLPQVQIFFRDLPIFPSSLRVMVLTNQNFGLSSSSKELENIVLDRKRWREILNTIIPPQ